MKVMKIDANEFLQKYSEARDKVNDSRGDQLHRKYWQGVMDTYHGLIRNFTGLGEMDVCWYVFYEGLSYDEAIAAYEKSSNKVAEKLGS